ncbi:hypothetical protein H1D32_15510 [Anaerobacillus sp. CMMVII]|uniref:hypothetical protein n=1 Tax=Anaerobacillus sp. CMMVII TaxID=2755588 RepID=UPI0021B7E671|nr:hypothetical protein [Anaerobacillus sp. CMMVII]MCT8138996.1 hypothetical protein [Anaerobacillus sp. CMMVII]
MNTWILVLSVLPYVCICIFVMSLVWRYNDHDEDEGKKPLKMISLVSFPLFILFIFTTPLIYLSLFESGQIHELIQWLIKIATLTSNYEGIVSASSASKLYILFACSILVTLSFTSLFKVWTLISLYFEKKLASFYRSSTLYAKVIAIFIISLFTMTK